MVKSDLGSQFINNLQEELDALIGVTRLTTCGAYSPKNSPCERGHQELHAILAKLMDHHAEWSEYLDYVAFAYNSTINLATKFTPNVLHPGQELGFSLNLLLPKPSTTYEHYGLFAAEVREWSEVAHELAREYLNYFADLAKRMYVKKVRPQSFIPDD